jgi:signal transduction histidine kinase
MNLISNKSEIHVEIIDFGIGMKTSQNYLILSIEQVRKEQGTGLGLYIVKTFIEKTPYNRVRKPTWKGTKATLRLPKL